MTDRPILFSGPMVRALLSGRKTMTRRVLKPQPPADSSAYAVARSPGASRLCWEWRRFHEHGDIRVPYATGSRLWVRETVAAGACAPSRPAQWAPSFWRREQGTPKNRNGLWYAADGLSPEKPITERGPWASSIHMPRWASRITLLVDEVKVERLQDITYEDAEAEGVQIEHSLPPDVHRAFVDIGGGEVLSGYDTREAFSVLWNHINGAGAWNANPWVAAIRFRVVKANIDSLPAEAA